MAYKTLDAKEIAEEAISTKAPILFLDTCAIFDIIRSIKRNNTIYLSAAKKLIERIDANNNFCQIVLSSVVYQEYKDNNKNVFSELDNFFTNLYDSLRIIYEANKVFGNKFEKIDINNIILKKNIENLVNILFINSLNIKDEDIFHTAASRRVVKCIPPASKGRQELKDCLIVEEYLEVCRKVRKKDKSLPLLFLSSNSKDFCIVKTKEIKDKLAKEFQSYGLEYCYSWQHVLSNLNRMQVKL